MDNDALAGWVAAEGALELGPVLMGVLAGGPGSGVLLGGEPAERGVGPVGVVLGAPCLHEDSRVDQGAELFDVEQLVADAAVERFDEGFSHGEPGSM